MTVCALVIDHRAGIGSGTIRGVYAFGDFDAARAVHDELVAAVGKWHDRANDRDRMFTFHSLGSIASVDVSEIAAVGIDNSMGEHREKHEDWAAHCGRLNALASGRVPNPDETGR
jgi:hypothetical protein